MPQKISPRAPEFSRPVDIARLAGVKERRIEASPAERAALARRFGILGIDSLGARVRLAPVARGVRLDAEFEAEVVQECVVTLEPVRSVVVEQFSIIYGEPSTAEAQPIGEDDDLVEPLPGNELDIGEAVAQQLSLALDPYPRLPGAEFPEEAREAPSDDHPFAALAKLRQRR
jgi:uncharacterized metal-binding protein YceD (DUF177 family)